MQHLAYATGLWRKIVHADLSAAQQFLQLHLATGRRWRGRRKATAHPRRTSTRSRGFPFRSRPFHVPSRPRCARCGPRRRLPASAVTAEGDGGDGGFVAAELIHEHLEPGVPKTDGVIERRGGDEVARRMNGDCSGAIEAGRDLGALIEVPQGDGAVGSARRSTNRCHRSPASCCRARRRAISIEQPMMAVWE